MRHPAKRLEGKVALITGAGEGQGRAAARLFAREGAKIGVLDVIPDRAEQTVAEIHSHGGEALPLIADVGEASQVEAAVNAAVERFGALHVVYNNAGVWLDGDGPVHELDLDTWHRTMRINVDGVLYGCRFGIPHMIAAGGGSIINTSSPVAIRPGAIPFEAYATSKGAVLSLTRSLAMHYGRQGIRANVLMPGYIESAQTRDSFADPDTRARVQRSIPIGRIGTPEDMASTALHLASDESSFVTGGVFHADGGWALGGSLAEFDAPLA